MAPTPKQIARPAPDSSEPHFPPTLGWHGALRQLFCLLVAIWTPLTHAAPIIDLMVLYSPQALEEAGSDQTLNALIQQAVRETNEAYANSGIHARVRLVHTAPTMEDERGNTSADLDRLEEPGDGFYDNAHSLRETMGADLVSLILEAPSSSGVGRGNQLSSLSEFFGRPFDQIAYTVILRRSLVGTYTLAHELGHNLGANHTASDQGSPGRFDFSNGWRFSSDGNTYRTIMARQFGSEVPYFSNPAITFNGVPTGSPASSETPADNAATINQTAPDIAAYRPTQVSNDTFSTAIPIEGFWASTTGSNIGATAEPSEPPHAGTPAQHSVWWTWRSPVSGEIELSSVGTTFPHRMAVYRGTGLADLQPLAAQTIDPAPASPSPIVFSVVPGQDLVIAVDSTADTQGFIALQLSRRNDNFADRIRLSTPLVTSTVLNRDASTEAREPAHGNALGFFGRGSRSVWWEWQAPASGTVTVSTQGTSYQNVLGVYQGGTVSELDLVAEENFTGSNGDWRTVRFEAIVNERYQIAIAAVGGLGPNTGMATVNIDQTPDEELRFTSITPHPDGSITLRIEGFSSQAFKIETSIDLIQWAETDSYTSDQLPLVITLPTPLPNTHQYFRTSLSRE